MTIKFGTDGWRGRIAEDYTFDNVRRCTQGFAAYLIKQGKHGEKVVVGHDRRFGSEQFAAAAAEVLAANGFQVRVTQRADADAGHLLLGAGSTGRGRDQYHRQPQPGVGQRL